MRTNPSHRLASLLGALSLGLAAACSAPADDDAGRGPIPGTEDYGGPVREAYTTYWEVHVEDVHVGYLLAYDFTADDHQLSRIDHHLDHRNVRPAREFTAEDLRDHDVFDRSMPAGSYRILDLDFRGLGTVKPNGEVLRHDRSGADSLGVHDLVGGLRTFYDAQDVRLVKLRDSVASEPDDEIS